MIDIRLTHLTPEKTISILFLHLFNLLIIFLPIFYIFRIISSFQKTIFQE